MSKISALDDDLESTYEKQGLRQIKELD
jgi:hypothetical protein